MEKIDYLEDKVNKLLSEINYLEKKLNAVLTNADKVEFVEVIYDKDGEDENLNWGYKSGIKGGTTVKGKDISKYKRLKIYSAINYCCSCYIVDLTKIVNNHQYYYGSICNSRLDGTAYYYGSRALIAKDKSSIQLTYFRNTTLMANNVSYFCYKIEGIY
ncbi:MAG: hypothetical protein IJW32_03425 [Clostridia bacterium]|nr:hypothetical protein [Clostridia bacterium]